MDVFKYFISDVRTRILFELDLIGTHYPSKIAKNTKVTYSHTVHVLQDFKKMGLIETEKKGRLQIIRLTKKGKLLTDTLKDFRRNFERRGWWKW